jgi:hypothetical protein
MGNQLKGLIEVKELLFNNALRYHHITQSITLNNGVRFTVALSNLNDEIEQRVLGILKTSGFINIEFQLIDHY